MILAHSPRRWLMLMLTLIRHARAAAPLLLTLLPGLLLLCVPASAPAQQSAAKLKQTQAVCPSWPRWETFKTRFISPEGRVIDLGSPDTRTTSEGQSYGLFFAMVANDKPTFEKLLAWTQNNLAEGDLTAHLPAWLWGESTDGIFKVLDTNSASDADLWIAYSLVQAGRQWRERRFTAIGALLAKRIVQEETAALPGLGRSLLPAPVGYQLGEQRWRLNPSYLPLQVLQGLATALPDQPQWRQLRAPTLRLLIEPAVHGFAPDWVLYRAAEAETAPSPTGDAPGSMYGPQSGGFSGDTATAAAGSYNAIRAYLWAGMLAPGDSARAALLKTYQPMADYVGVHGYPPETVDTVTGAFGPNAGFKGFSAAVLPMLSASNQSALADGQLERIKDLDKQTLGYYSEVLTLFGTGWREGRFRFAADGSLLAAWNDTCSPAQ